MKILILYCKMGSHVDRDRNTFDEHLNSFRRYVENIRFHYFNATFGIPKYLTLIPYDGIILHYTFLVTRWNRTFFAKWRPKIKNLKKISGYKVAIPQDEYAETAVLHDMFREFGVESVFTCLSKADFEKAYPSKDLALKHKITVFPGYVDENAISYVKKFCKKNHERPIVIGYRARKLPYWIGRHGQLKHEIAVRVIKELSGMDLRVDISTDDKDAFLGIDWYKFLCRCQTVLGCEGGASLLDLNGNIRKCVERCVELNPDISFEEVEKKCFFGKDYHIRLFSLSPRHFECAVTKTCQILLEGNYGGIFQPNIHYIELKKDYSNMKQVIQKAQNKAYCAHIAENAFRDIVLSGKYSYRIFANTVIDHIQKNRGKNSRKTIEKPIMFSLLGRYLRFREFLDPVLVKWFYLWLVLAVYRMSVFKMIWDRIIKGLK